MTRKEEQAPQKSLSGLPIGLACVAALLAGSVETRAQEGPLATFGLSLGARYVANDPDEDERLLEAGLSFDLRRATRTQVFLVSVDGRIVYDETGAEFEDPGLILEYGRETRSTALQTSLAYSVRDVAGSFELIDPVTGNILDLVNDDGTVETVRIGAGLETGRDARFGTSTEFSITERTYSGTSDPDLTDLRSTQIATALRFDVSPLVQVSGTASYRATQEDDVADTENRTTRLGLDATFRLDALWTATAGLSYARFETEIDVLTGTRILDTQEGGGFSASVRRQFRAGALGASVNRSFTEIGAEDTLSLFGGRTFADASELTWSLGLVTVPGGDTVPVFSASYALPTPRGGLSVDFSRTTAVSDEDDSVTSTSLGLGWSQQIDALSSWSLDGSLLSIGEVSDTGEGQTRAEIGIAYNYALTRDWDLSTSLSRRVTYVSGEEDNSASILSLSLQRSFSLRP